MSDELIGPNPCSECDGEYGRHGSCCSKASVPVSAVTDESDTTNERPGEAGVCFYNGKPVMVTMMGSKPVVHFPMEGGGFATNYQPTGTFEKAVPASELATLKARLAEAEQQRDKFKRIDECNQGTIDIAIRRAEAAEGRVKKIQTAWNRVAGFAVSESCGPENRFRITIDYPTLEKLQDAYRAMHDITTAIATTPPAAGAQSS